MRPRFKTARICSSDNYRLSIKIHYKLLQENHYSNLSFLQEIKSTTKVAYTVIFGKKIKLTKEDIKRLNNSINIYYE